MPAPFRTWCTSAGMLYRPSLRQTMQPISATFCRCNFSALVLLFIPTPKACRQIVTLQPHTVRFAWEVAQNHCFRVVITHPCDIECAIFPFGRFSDRAHLRFLFARFLSVDLLLLRRFKSLSIFRYDSANNLNSSLLIRKTPPIPNRLLPAAHGQ